MELAAHTATPKNPHELRNSLKPSQTPAEGTADMAVEGLAMNAVALHGFSSKLGVLDLTEACARVIETARTVANGDLSPLEMMLAAQAIVLNTVFTDS